MSSNKGVLRTGPRRVPRRITMPVLAVLGAVLLAGAPAAEAATPCEALPGVALAHTAFTLARTVPAGAYTPPNEGNAQAFAGLPAFCQVQATLTPTGDSDIKMELWMPVAGSWNGRLQGTGNGGLGGGLFVNPGGLAAGVRLGYATVGTNAGHDGDPGYALSHPEKIIDFGMRAAHEMTLKAKALIAAYYDAPLQYSLMSVGGGGTIAGLSSAQNYPDDYDIIAIRSMSSSLSRHTAGQLWMWMATHQDAASYIHPEKYPLLHQAALNACDANDGLADGIIGNPESCRFDPAVLQCEGAIGGHCLSAAQVAAARKIYSGPINPRTGEEIYSPMYPGSELTWNQLAGGDEPIGIAVNFYKYFVFQDPDWDYRRRPLNFDSDIALADRPELAVANAISPDLDPYFAAGGKLLMIGGWNDTGVPPKVSTRYYRSVVATIGEPRARRSMRFFMVPGMGHGPGTNGPDNFNFDALAIIEEWQRTGVAPEHLIVDHYKDGALAGRRLVCQYPQTAFYRGHGNTEDPASFVCR